MIIGLVVGVLFLLLAAGGIALTAIASSKKRGSPKYLKWIGLGTAAVFGVLFIFIPFSIHTVDTGEVAVVKHLGKATVVRTPGTYFDFWMTEEYASYDAKVQNLEMDANTYSKDAQTMDIAMVVQYSIKQERALNIAEQYGTLSALGNRIASIAEATTKSTLSAYSAMEIIENRAQISVEVESEVKDAIDDTFFVNIEKVVLTNIDFSDAFEQTVEDKMIAEQEKLKAEYEKETALVKAEQELEVAKLNAEARIAEAEGDAEARLLIAQAEANAIKAKSIEIARALGFAILETPVYEQNAAGENVQTGTEYAIDFTGKSDAQIALITEYLKYIEYLEAWNGELPDTVVTGEGGSFILPLPGSGTASENGESGGNSHATDPSPAP